MEITINFVKPTVHLFSLLDIFTYLYECTSVERELKGCKVDMKEVKKSGEGAGARKVGGAANRAMSPVRINRDELEKVLKIKILGHNYTFLPFPLGLGCVPRPCLAGCPPEGQDAGQTGASSYSGGVKVRKLLKYFSSSLSLSLSRPATFDLAPAIIRRLRNPRAPIKSCSVSLQRNLAGFGPGGGIILNETPILHDDSW